MKSKQERIQQLEAAVRLTEIMSQFLNGVLYAEKEISVESPNVEKLTDDMFNKSLKEWAETLDKIFPMPSSIIREMKK